MLGCVVVGLFSYKNDLEQTEKQQEGAKSLILPKYYFPIVREEQLAMQVHLTLISVLSRRICSTTIPVLNGVQVLAQYWLLCFARLCYCLEFHGSEASVVKEFYSGRREKPQNFQHHKMAAKRSQRAMLHGQYCLFTTSDEHPRPGGPQTPGISISVTTLLFH